jgi:calcium-dependent protein kinase
LLSGKFPFQAKTSDVIKLKNKKAIIKFKKNDWSKISLPAKNMVKRMLFKDPSDRMSVE